MTNEQIYSDFIKEKGFKSLNTEWVLEMLETIEKADQEHLKINPDWLRATGVIWRSGTPFPYETPMTIEETDHA